MTKHKCYISFKTEDIEYKTFIQNELDVEMIDKSLNEPINSQDDDYIMRVIREKYLSDSTVTIFLIGEHSSERLGQFEQRFIKRELQASLYNGGANTRSGILGVVLPSMVSRIYRGQTTCSTCGRTHNLVQIDESTVIREFSYNYYLPNPKAGCSHAEEDRYCVLVPWDDFVISPEQYIEQAFQKRTSEAAKKVQVFP